MNMNMNNDKCDYLFDIINKNNKEDVLYNVKTLIYNMKFHQN